MMASTLTHDLAAFQTPVAGQPTFFLMGPVAQFLATPEENAAIGIYLASL